MAREGRLLLTSFYKTLAEVVLVLGIKVKL